MVHDGSVFMMKPLVQGRFGTSGNIKFEYKGYELSAAFDDSCGTGMVCHRNHLSVFRGKTDITEEVLGKREIYEFSFVEFCEHLARFKAYCEICSDI